MGSGKSTIGRLLDPELIDMDSLLEEELGMPISVFFQEVGQAVFREKEGQLLSRLVNQEGWVSTGGGIVTSSSNRSILKKGWVVYLEADFETIYSRLRRDKDNQRPLFINLSKEEFQALFRERQAYYQEVADLVIQVGGKTPEDIAKEITCALLT